MPKLLGCLERQTFPRERLEVLIVDDSSTDSTADIVRASGLARLLQTERRGGAYIGRNVGLRAARGEVIAITDADCEPVPDWLEAGLEDLDRLGVDMLGGHIEVPLRDRPSVAELVDVARYLDQERSIRDNDVAMTANFFARREVYDKTGPFNERLISNGDIEFSLRAKEAGFRIAYSKRAAVIHEPRLRARDLAGKCYRMGIGTSQIMAFGQGPGRERKRIWTAPGAYLIRPGVWGEERLHAKGFRPSRLQRARITLGEYFFVQLPLIAGSFVGTLRTRRAA